MALESERQCDRCGRKTSWIVHRPPDSMPECWSLGSVAALCSDCSETHMLKVVPIHPTAGRTLVERVSDALMQWKSVKEMAEAFEVDPNSVQQVVKRMYNRAELTREKAIRDGRRCHIYRRTDA